jgi:hypothetical protein
MGDIDALIRQLGSAHLVAGQPAFVSGFVRFPDRGSWERAATSVRLRRWQVASYSKPQAYMIRMSRPISLTAEDLENTRGCVRDFARETGGQWESLAVEDLTCANAWDEFAADHLGDVEVAAPMAVPSEIGANGAIESSRETA